MRWLKDTFRKVSGAYVMPASLLDSCQLLIASELVARKLLYAEGWCDMIPDSLDFLRWYSPCVDRRELGCKDGWFNPEMETGSSMAPSQSVGQTLFNLYKLCRFALDAGVPGLAWSQPPYVWLTANDLLRFSSNESQEVFYMAAGIQTAVFIPCGIGVVELGTTKLVQPDEQNKMRFSSLLANVIASPNISGILTGGLGLETSLVYPGSSAQRSVPDPLLFPQTSQASGFPVAPSAGSMMLSAFDIWRPPSKTSSQPVVEGQYTLKRSLAILRTIHAERLGQISMFESERPPGGTVSSGQVHRVIYERRRREKLRESFDALLRFIPRGARKDKASILEYTREYLTSLKSRGEALEDRNKQLESELKKFPRAQSQEGGATSTAQEGAGTSRSLQQQGSTGWDQGGDSLVTVEVSKIGESSSTAASDEMANIVVVVDSLRNPTDLMIALLQSLREMRVPLLSMATSRAHHEHDPSHLRYRMTASIKLQDHDMEQVRIPLVSIAREHGGPPPP